MLQVAPSTFYAARRRGPSKRALSDAALKPKLEKLWVDNRKVYGAFKLWKAANKAGIKVGRDRVARLMAELNIRGVSKKRTVVTTVRNDGHGRPPDLVDRQFVADGPNELWVTDLTYVPTREAMAYVCFIVDVYSRFIVGWTVADNMKTQMVLDALEMARADRGADLDGLIAHSDAGSQYTSIRWTERLNEIGATPSVGSVADSYDNAMAESVNSLYKTELVYHPDQTGWNSIGELELATLGWVHWYNHQRLHGSLNHRTPAETETSYTQTTPKILAKTGT